MTTPHKKPRKRELSEQQKAENKIFSSKRIFSQSRMRHHRAPYGKPSWLG